jgi:hypothetical protein
MFFSRTRQSCRVRHGKAEFSTSTMFCHVLFNDCALNEFVSALGLPEGEDSKPRYSFIHTFPTPLGPHTTRGSNTNSSFSCSLDARVVNGKESNELTMLSGSVWNELRATNDAAGRNNVLNMMKFHNATNNMVSWREEESMCLLLLSVPKVTVHASTGNRKQETRMHQTPFWLIRKTARVLEF